MAKNVQKMVCFDEVIVPEVQKNADGTEARIIEAIASQEEIDRHGDVVLMEALKAAIPGYMRNPVILAGHQHVTDDGTSPVVGKCLKAVADVKAKKLHITVEFADTELGLEYYKLYKGKYQRAFSIGFAIKQHDNETYAGERVLLIKELELYEISCVAVGANRGALSKSATRKLDFINRKKITRGNAEYDETIERAKSLLSAGNVDEESQECILGGDQETLELFVKDSDFRTSIIKVLTEESIDDYIQDDDGGSESDLAKELGAFKGEFNKALGGVFEVDKYLKFVYSDGVGSNYSVMEKEVFTALKEQGLDAAKEVFINRINPKTGGKTTNYAAKFK